MSDNFSIEDIKKIRDLTGVGLTEAKQALQTHRSFDEALAAMRAQGLSKALKREDRSTQAGVVLSYVHDQRIGVLLEVNCETDFVAKTDDFLSLVKDLALQIAASRPVCLKPEDLKEDFSQEEEHLRQKAAEDKVPLERLDEVVAQQLQKLKSSKCLLSQSFNKEPSLTVGEFLQNRAAKLGEKIVIARFVRFELGQSEVELFQNETDAPNL